MFKNNNNNKMTYDLKKLKNKKQKHRSVGKCVATTAPQCPCVLDVDCDDANPCTRDVCEGGGCVYVAARAGTVCRAALAGGCDIEEVLCVAYKCYVVVVVVVVVGVV
jgi:hypothetical protein